MEPANQPSQDDCTGASPNERLLFSAKQDLEDLFLEVEEAGGYDINFQDGLGNTALHYAVMHLSPNVLELILEHEGADVDLINKQGYTPLHCSAQIQHSKPRLLITKSLLEAGADPRIRSTKAKEKPIEMIRARQKSEGSAEEERDDEELIRLLNRFEAESNLDQDDIVNVDEDDEDDVGSDDVASD